VAPRHAPELENDYLAHLLAHAKVKLDGMVIVLDCANGAGSRVAPRVLGRLGAQVIPIGCEPDGDNINEGCGSTHPSEMQESVRLHNADLGIALDGDGDRCMLCDEKGALVNGDGILTITARHAAANSALHPKKIVATVMSNRGLHRAMREADIEVRTVGVGDRRVVEALREEHLGLGGEQSGHIVFGSDNAYIGDGTYTALRCLQVLCDTGKKLSELVLPYQPFPQVLLNVTVSSRPGLSELPSIVEHVRKIEQHLGDDGRVLLRYSGTEPLARIMVEGPDEEWIRTRAQELANLIVQEIGA
jgi:phosphoglucosamine mutase